MEDLQGSASRTALPEPLTRRARAEEKGTPGEGEHEMPILDELAARFDEMVEDLRAVAKRRMFGCDAWFAGGTIFGLIWQEGRIGVRLPDEAAFAELMGTPGAEPWRVGTKPMSHWVLVPEAFVDDEAALRRWIERAHALALAAPPKVKKGARRKAGAEGARAGAAKKTAAAKGVAAVQRTVPSTAAAKKVARAGASKRAAAKTSGPKAVATTAGRSR